MSAVAEIHQTHQRLFQLIFRHGTEAEQVSAREALEQMREVRQVFADGAWEPMEQVTLPSFLVAKCKRVAVERQGRAKRFSLENKHGVTRTLEEEVRSVEAQTACALILGLPLFAVPNHAAGKAHGNVGSNVSAFCPRPGSYQLIIGEKEPPTRQFFLMHVDGGASYRCEGWIRAGLGMRDEFQKTYTRDVGNVTHVSRPYVVPTDMLSPVREWFQSRA